MAKRKEFEVTLYPADIKRGYPRTRFEIGGKHYPRKTIYAAKLPDLLAEIEKFAAQYGKGCRAMVDCKASRKPPGFDRDTEKLYYNLEAPPKEETSAKVRFTQEEIARAITDDNGLCINCGATKENCEGDASHYRCDECGKNTVYGAEAIIIMGLVNEIGDQRPDNDQ